MVLPSKGFRGFSVVELTVTLAPVNQVAVIGGFFSFDINESIFGVRDSRKGL